MNSFTEIFSRGVRFVRDNPQIIYTLFLVVAIPLAFFWTNERFASLARESKDRLEYSKISFLHDGFRLFVAENLEREDELARGLETIAKENDTMQSALILGNKSASSTDDVRYYPILASTFDKEIGAEYPVYDRNTFLSFDQAFVDVHRTIHTLLSGGEGRYWRSVRAVTATDSEQVVGFIVTEMSLSESDRIFAKEQRNTFAVSIAIILSIMVLLARQARIIDYATLYAKLKDVDRMKDDFVSMAAHELRSPLTIIRGYTEMVGESDKLTEKEHGHLKSIDRAATQLNTLIGDILDVAKLQEGRMSFAFKDLDVSEEIETVVTSFVRPAKDKGLLLTYERSPLPLISVDVDRFRQVIVNFVGNAIKYTPSGSVRVLTAVEGDRLSIRISDTGMGISAEDQKKLFQKFFRVKGSETSGITGTGLGLWITQEIVKTMQGTISVESIKGKGTDFIVSFPIKK